MGRLGTAVCGWLKFKAYARLLMSLLASRGVSGASPQRHSINFSTDVWSKTSELIRGFSASPRLKGDAITTGKRNPTSVLPPTTSVSRLFAAVAQVKLAFRVGGIKQELRGRGDCQAQAQQDECDEFHGADLFSAKLRTSAAPPFDLGQIIIIGPGCGSAFPG